MSATDAPAPVRPNRGVAARVEWERRTNSFTQLAQQVRAADLNARTPGFYLVLFGGLVAVLAASLAGMVLLGDSWFQLLIAAVLGLLFTQFAFLGHEASHRQVFASGPANDRFGRLLATVFVGISYAWWMTKHTRHHGNPNQIGRDPDIAPGWVSFTDEDAVFATGFRAWITRRQGWLFYPLMLLLGLDLHQASIRRLFRPGKLDGRATELALIGTRFALYLGLVFWVMPLGMAFAFLAVQVGVFGLYMGISFAPNHIGMPIVPHGAKLDFLDKQVLTSRNVSGGWWATALMGGLNYQIEHHLFPGMPRPHLRQARLLVREHCRAHGVPYVENNLGAALTIVVRYINDVGWAARHSFSCPAAASMGRG
ncbi:acyl-CoA desaturase [Micropruina sp.]|uniref:fatty acid desaturase family protein n=1 Tax=Micropruina sp. TaxID=2737536 RepID=UPI002633A009|nr:acyl-CoA desaturase [Micropruina sp.]